MAVERNKQDGSDRSIGNKNVMKRRVVKIGLWIVGAIVALVIIAFAVAMWLLTPDRLTPIVNKYASQYLNAEVSFSRIEVSLFNDFPRVELSLRDGIVVSKVIENRQDTLLTFAALDLSCDAMKILTSNRIEVRGCTLDSTSIHAVIDTTGRPSWDIMLPSVDTIKDNSQSEPFVINIDQLRITRTFQAKIDDLRDSSYVRASFNSFVFDGMGSTEIKELKFSELALVDFIFEAQSDGGRELINSTIDKLHIQHTEQGYRLQATSRSSIVQQGKTLAHKLPVTIDATIGYNPAQSSIIALKNSEIRMNDIALSLDGKVDFDSDSTLISDLRLKIRQFPVSHALGLIPSHITPWLKNVSSSVEIELDSKIKGSYNLSSGKLPNIDAQLIMNDGFVRYRGAKARLDRFGLMLKAHYNGDTLSKSYASISQLSAHGSGVDLEGSMSIENIFSDPHVKGEVKGSLNMGVLSVMFPAKNAMTASGIVGFDARCDSKISNMQLSSLAQVKVTGQAELNKLTLNSPIDSLYLYTNGVMDFFSARNTQDTTMEMKLPVLRAQIDLDTISMEWGNELKVNSGALDIRATTSAKFFTPSKERIIRPLRLSVTANRMRANMADSTALVIRKADIKISLDPTLDDPTTPQLTTKLGARAIAVRSQIGRFTLSDPLFTLNSMVISRQKDSIMRAEAMLDRLAKRYPHIERGKLLQYNKMMQIVGIAKKDDLASGDINMTLDKDMLSLLRRWSSSGELSARRLRIITPYMPLTTTLTDFDFKFDNNNIELADSKLQVGRSDIELTGKLSNISRALAGRGNLICRMNISGDTLDLNQLISAMNAGSKVASTVDLTQHEEASEDKVAEIIAKEAQNQTLNQLIIVPKNIDLDVTLSVKKAFYSDIDMNELQGELISRDRILQINNLRANSSIGHMGLNAVYATRSKEDITTGFDITLSGVNVKELIDLIPEVDSMLPMLRSFEGHLDCKLAATASLDTTMSLLTPTLNAAGSISGRNMVLLDGETFTEISKILKFKNRSRNVVDKISVEMLIRNSAVEIFPFVIDIDRYRAAVSGVQKLDMSFDYHISVLKSIIPFRLGVDIFGKDLDNWDFKITKARYKNENVPSYSTLIDTTRIDLRKAITDIFKTGIENLVLRDAGITPHVDSSLMAFEDSLRHIAPADSITQKIEIVVDKPKIQTKRTNQKEERKGRKTESEKVKSIKRNEDETPQT